MSKMPTYQTLNEKQQFFAPSAPDLPWCVDSPAEFDRLYDRLAAMSAEKINIRISPDETTSVPTSTFQFFRGVNEAAYKTYTSAQRYWCDNAPNPNSRQGFIEFIENELNALKQDPHIDFAGYLQSIGVHPNDVYYLSFLQHFGGATPFLDLTHDLDSALFFAFDKMRPGNPNNPIANYVSLYFMDYRAYQSVISDMCAMLHSGLRRGEEIYTEARNNPAHQDIDVNPGTMADIAMLMPWLSPEHDWCHNDLSSMPIGIWDIPIDYLVVDLSGHELLFSNFRMWAQKGAFLMYTDCQKPLEEYFCDKKFPYLRCFNIHKDLAPHIQAKINKRRWQIYPSEECLACRSRDMALDLLTCGRFTRCNKPCDHTRNI